MSVTYEHTKQEGFDEDVLLVDRVLADDPRAFQQIYEKYHDKVYAIARGILIDSDEAADAVQEVFTLVYRKITKFDRRSKFSTWLFRIAVNRSIQQTRRLKWKRLHVPIGEAVESVAADVAPAPSDDARVALSMAGLQPNDRAILTLFYWDELTLQEIAESLGCSPNAAKTRLFRARERFREIYEELPEP